MCVLRALKHHPLTLIRFENLFSLSVKSLAGGKTISYIDFNCKVQKLVVIAAATHIRHRNARAQAIFYYHIDHGFAQGCFLTGVFSQKQYELRRSRPSSGAEQGCSSGIGV